MRQLCKCIHIDVRGESDCKYSVCELSSFGFACRHECVMELTQRLKAEENARIAAEEKLEKYRNAIGPFVSNCRAVIDAVDEKEGGEQCS